MILLNKNWDFQNQNETQSKVSEKLLDLVEGLPLLIFINYRLSHKKINNSGKGEGECNNKGKVVEKK